MNDLGDPPDLLDLLDRIVAQAQPGEGVEAYGLEETETSVKVHGGRVEALSAARTRGVGIRVVADHRVGYAHTAMLEEPALAQTLEDARRNALVGTPDEANVLVAPSEAQPLPHLHDGRFAAVTPEDKVEVALRLEAAVLAAGPPVTGVHAARYGDSERRDAIASTTGVRAAFRRCDAFVMAEVLAERDGATTSAYGLDLARTPGDLDVDAAAGEGVARATRILGGRKPASGRIPVILDPHATAALLGVLAGALTAEAVQRGRSLFAGRVGESLAADHVTLVDDGRHPDGHATRPWDGEGTPTSRTTLLEAGTLRGFLHNGYTAAREGVASTGNARRAGYRSPPGLGPTNLYFEPGHQPAEALLAEAGTAFYCQDVMGLHSGANPVSGDLSVGAVGVMVRNGQMAEPVREATVAGSIPGLLAGVRAVGADLRFSLPFAGGMGGTTLLVDGMTLGGQ